MTTIDELEAMVGDHALVVSEIMRETNDPEAVLQLRARLFDIQQTYNYLVSEVDQAIIRLHPYDPERPPIVLPGGGTVAIQGGNIPVRIDHPALESRFVEAVVEEVPAKAVVNEDGEVVDGLRDLVADLVRRTIDAVAADTPSFKGYRSTVLKRYGIKLKDYATEMEKTPLTVVIRGRGKEGV